MKIIRIILGVLLLVVLIRAVALLAAGQSGITYPVAAIAVGIAGCLVLFARRR